MKLIIVAIGLVIILLGTFIYLGITDLKLLQQQDNNETEIEIFSNNYDITPQEIKRDINEG